MNEQIKERPILFSGPMVRALLAGTKTQTRRIVKTDDRPMPKEDTFMRGFPTNPQNVRMLGAYAKCDAPAGQGHVSYRVPCPYGMSDERLWVKETFMPMPHLNAKAFYRASDPLVGGKWKPSIFMTRALSRITLEITFVTVERLNDISEADAIAEGVTSVMPFLWRPDEWQNRTPNIARYAGVWESINGPGSWALNPFVWVVKFKRL